MPLNSLTNIRNLISDKSITDKRLYDALNMLVNELNQYTTKADALIASLQAQLAGKAATGATVLWGQVDKTGSSLADLATRSASDLSSGALPDARLTGTYNSAVTLANSGNSLRGAFKSSDGTSGITATFNPTTLTSMTFKDGILTAKAP